MTHRIAQKDVYALQPALAKNLIGLTQAASTAIDHKLIHLIKLRASQINGCAFCQHMHLAEARKDGETQTRLDLLAVWREMPIFSAKEKAVLAWTEALTLINTQAIADGVYEDLANEFSQEEIVNITSVIVVINSWNRIAVGFNFLPNL